MKNIKLGNKIIFFILAILFTIFTLASCRQEEKAIIIEYQGFELSTELGINSTNDTVRTYKAMYVKDSVCFMYYTAGRFDAGDIISTTRE